MLEKERFIKEIQRETFIEAGDVFLIIALIEIREAIDRYIEQRIESNKVLEGVFKDIYSAIQESGSRN